MYTHDAHTSGNFSPEVSSNYLLQNSVHFMFQLFMCILIEIGPLQV